MSATKIIPKKKRSRIVKGSTALLNRFYIGHPKMSADARAINPQWAKRTMEEAVLQAVKFLEDNEKIEECLIVEIVKTVRRQKRPIVIENITKI